MSANVFANTISDTSNPSEIIEQVLSQHNGRVCITNSFQAEDMVVLGLLRQHVPDVHVLFLETGYHFEETLAFRDRMVKKLGLNLVNVQPGESRAEQESTQGLLYHIDPGRCCHLRKVEPLIHALEGFDIWFTGLRREQSPTRRNLKFVEHHQLPTEKVLLKVNPLAAWNWEQVWRYTLENKIEYLPLYDLGYRSIGCEPCTSIPTDDANPRSGRWHGKKLECGIHTFSKPQNDRGDEFNDKGSKQ